MDATPLSEKAPPAAQQKVEPSPSDAAAGVKTSGGEDDDEQVEKFYALLENIRAMRGMVGAGGTATAAERKRAREAEPPWRPAFRMEDFELEEVRSDDAAPCCHSSIRTRRESNGGARRRSASGRETTGGEEEGEVVEAEDPHPTQRKHKRRTGVLAADS